MIRLIAILPLLASGLAAAAGGGASVTLVFRDRVQVDRAQITLADIAEIRAPSDVLRQRLQDVAVGNVRQVGVERVVKRELVLAAISRRDDRLSLVPAGAAETRVVRRSYEYAATRMISMARAYLMKQLQSRYPSLTRVAVENIGAVDDLRLPSADVVVRPRAIQGNGLTPRACVWLDVLISDRVLRRIPIWFSVKAYAPVVVARAPINPRDVVTPRDFAVEERDVARVRGEPLQRIDDVVGMRARVSVSNGAVVRVADLEKNPPVLANQEVEVRVVAGPVRVETRAVAEQEGYVGELVRVRNPKTFSVFTARVTGDKTVQVTQKVGGL